MKPRTILLSLAIVISCALQPITLMAQGAEVQQLLLNVEKLSQLRSILSDMKMGYEIIHQGYGAVKDISEGSFNLHEAFLNGLLEVNPVVRKYKRVADIIRYQKQLVSENKSAHTRYRLDGSFTFEELEYLSAVYANLFKLSLRNLDELTLLLTAGEFRMSDEERLSAIDRIFQETEDKLLFLRHFNRQVSLLAIQRAKDQRDILSIQKLYK